MGLFSRKKQAPPAGLDLDAVQLDWAEHLAQVRLLVQLQTGSTEPSGRGEASRSLLLRLVELAPAQQASLVRHQHLLMRAVWRRDVAEQLPHGPFRTYDQPWLLAAMAIALPLALLHGDDLLEPVVAGRPESLIGQLKALTNEDAGDSSDLWAFAAVVHAISALAVDPAPVTSHGPVITTMRAALEDPSLWPGAPSEWAQTPGRYDLDHNPLRLDQDEKAQGKVSDKMGSGVRREFTLSSTVPARLVGPRIGANVVGSSIFIGAVSGLLDTYLQVLASWCARGIEQEDPEPDGPALSHLPVPLSADPMLDVLVRYDVRLRGRLARADERLDSPDVVQPSFALEGTTWVLELPLPHGETGPIDLLTTAHLRMVAACLLQVPALSPQATQVLTEVAGLSGVAGGLAVSSPRESAAAVATQWLAEGVAKA